MMFSGEIKPCVVIGDSIGRYGYIEVGLNLKYLQCLAHFSPIDFDEHELFCIFNFVTDGCQC